MSSVPAHSPVASLPRGEGIALSERLVSHPAACRFAAATGLPSPSQAATGESPYSRADYVRGHVFSLLGRESDGQACNTYDIVWSLALAMDEAGYDPGRVREILPHVAGRWSGLHGASGQVVLNPAGDRESADYDFWLVNDRREWEKAGRWRAGTDGMEWSGAGG